MLVYKFYKQKRQKLREKFKVEFTEILNCKLERL